jgi:hypothetical protein
MRTSSLSWTIGILTAPSNFLVVVIAEFRLSHSLRIVGRLLRLDRDQAADRVLAEQRALRPLEDFHDCRGRNRSLRTGRG